MPRIHPLRSIEEATPTFLAYDFEPLPFDVTPEMIDSQVRECIDALKGCHPQLFEDGFSQLGLHAALASDAVSVFCYTGIIVFCLKLYDETGEQIIPGIKYINLEHPEEPIEERLKRTLSVGLTRRPGAPSGRGRDLLIQDYNDVGVASLNQMKSEEDWLKVHMSLCYMLGLLYAIKYVNPDA